MIGVCVCPQGSIKLGAHVECAIYGRKGTPFSNAANNIRGAFNWVMRNNRLWHPTIGNWTTKYYFQIPGYSSWGERLIKESLEIWIQDFVF